MSGWIRCTPDTMPEEDQVVFWHDAKTSQMWLGDYSDPGVDNPCLVATRSYHGPDWLLGGGWEIDDAEWEDDHPTHWRPMPELP